MKSKGLQIIISFFKKEKKVDRFRYIYVLEGNRSYSHSDHIIPRLGEEI